MSKQRYTKPGRRERAARKRHLRLWTVLEPGKCRMYAPFTYWIKYHADELASGLQPLKLGRKHQGRKLFNDLCVADSRNASKSKSSD